MVDWESMWQSVSAVAAMGGIGTLYGYVTASFYRHYPFPDEKRNHIWWCDKAASVVAPLVPAVLATTQPLPVLLTYLGGYVVFQYTASMGRSSAKARNPVCELTPDEELRFFTMEERVLAVCHEEERLAQTLEQETDRLDRTLQYRIGESSMLYQERMQKLMDALEERMEGYQFAQRVFSPEDKVRIGSNIRRGARTAKLYVDDGRQFLVVPFPAQLDEPRAIITYMNTHNHEMTIPRDVTILGRECTCPQESIVVIAGGWSREDEPQMTIAERIQQAVIHYCLVLQEYSD